MSKILYGTIWNKVNDKYSGKIGGLCYVSSTLEKVVVDSIEQLANWKVPFDTYDIRCYEKGTLIEQGQFTKFLRTI